MFDFAWAWSQSLKLIACRRMKSKSSSLYVSRRQFLHFGATVGTGLLLPSVISGAEAAEDLPTYAYRLLRDTDLLNVEVRFINFKLSDTRPLKLRPLGEGQSSIALIFPPQNLAEAIFDERHDDANFENDPIAGKNENDVERFPPIRSFLSGPSWVVFNVPDNAAPFDLAQPESWWARLEELSLRVAPGATGPWVPRMPRRNETALEIPFRLYMSPGPETRFSASRLDESELRRLQRLGKFAPVELWNASLTSRLPLVPARLPPGTTNIPEELQPPKRVVLQARALYSPDYQRRSEPRFSLYYPAERPLSLHALTRHRLVKQMSEGDGSIDIEHLILTALGADANLYYASRKTVDQIIEEQVSDKGDPGTELRMWKHRIVIGRDVFFVEAFFGFLFPFCHPAIYVELTQRKFVSYTEEARKEGEPKNDYDKEKVSAPGAYLLKRRFMLVQDPLKNFASSDSPVGRMMPTKRVTLRTVRSADLADPVIDSVPIDKPGGTPGTTGLFFWPRLESNNSIANWELEVEDESGQVSITTDAKLWFASNIKRGHWGYQDKTAAERTIPFPGTKIAFAPEKGPSKDLSTSVQSVLDQINKRTISVSAAKKTLSTRIRDIETKCSAQTDKIGDKAKEIGKEFDEVLRKASSDVQGFVETLGSYRKKLDQLNELGATLETNAITFASNFVRDEVEVARRLAAILNGVKKIDDVQTLVVEELEKADGIFKTLDGAARQRIRQGIQGILDTCRALRLPDPNNPDGKPATPDQMLEEFAKRAKPYLSQYVDFERAATNLGSSVFHAGMETARVVLPAVKGLLPTVPDREIQLVGDYITGKFGDIDGKFKGVQNGVYAALTEAIGKAEDIGGQIRNGLAKPSMVISGLSRELGAVASENLEKAKEFARTNLNDFQHKMEDAIPDAKLFGVIPLRKIVAPILRGQMPDINVIELPEKIERTWQWAGPVKEQNFGILTFLPKLDPVGLYIFSKTTVDIPKPKELASGAKPVATVELRAFLGHMKVAAGGKQPTLPDDQGGSSPAAKKEKVFAINLLDLIEVEVSELSIKTKYKVGESVPTPEVKPILAIKPVEFLGPLSFLGALQNGLSFGALDIAIDPEFVSARTNITIPPLTFGAFSCRNLALKSGVALPLGDRTLRYDFAFSSFKEPFELSVMGFAGRGYFGAAFESNGNRQLDGALEFGGALSFNVGVASGGLYVMAGGYLKINNGTTELAGYLRAGGQIDVLGLVHVCVEFFLALAYRNGEGESVLYGYCEITVSIDMILYSFDVHVGMEKVISGSKKEQTSNVSHAAIHSLLAPQSQNLLDAAARRYAPPAAMQAVPIYFSRGSMSDSSKVTGRFRSTGAWKNDYWSHFDFSGA